MAMTKETKPLFVYWNGREFKNTKNETEMVSVSFYREKGYEHPNYMSGFSSELIENLHEEEWDNLGEKEPITLTVEKGGPNSKAKDGFYWNLLAIELGHDSEMWPDGGPEEDEEDQVPAPKVVQPAPADDRDEFADYINAEGWVSRRSNKESGDHGQNKGQSQPNVPNASAIGACANHAADFIVAGLMSKPDDVDILDWHRDCRDVIYWQVNQVPPAHLRWCAEHGNVYRQDSKQRWYHKMGLNFCVEGQGVLDTDGKAVSR
jgi:hypothetical protein